MAHNPEVEGSNPSPATKARGPFSNRERAFCTRSAHDLAPSDDPPHHWIAFDDPPDLIML
jgi:hypothetical protein